MQCARHPTWHSRCIASIFTTLCPYYPGCDAVMGAACALVSCHIWRCGVEICMLYIYHIFRSSVRHVTHFKPTHPPIHIQPVVLRLRYTSIVVRTPRARNHCSPAQSLCCRLVDCRYYTWRCQPTAVAAVACSGRDWVNRAISYWLIISIISYAPFFPLVAVFNKTSWKVVIRRKTS